MSNRPSLALAATLLAPVVSVEAQEIEVLLEEGAVLTTVVPPVTVSGIENPTANTVGGWAIQFNGDDGITMADRIYGSVDGATAPSVFFEQGTYSVYEQGAFEFTIGFSDIGASVFSSVCTIGGVEGFDSVWIDTFPVAVEGDPILTLPGKVWRFASRPSVAAVANQPAFIAGINDVSGAVEGNGLFIGVVPSPLLQSGDIVPGLPFPLETGSSTDFDFRVSPDGQGFIDPVDMQSGSTSNDFAVVKDGAGLLIGGQLVREGSPLPAALQVDPAENWDNFDYFALLDDGTHFFSGDTDLDDLGLDEIIVKNESIVVREGDSGGGGFVWEGAIEALTASADGDLAFVWDINGGSDEALGFNGRVILKDSDGIDLDGDGADDGQISSFTGLNSLALSTERKIYATVDVDTLGTSTTTDDTEVLLEIAIPDLLASDDSISVSAGGTVDFTLFTRPGVVTDFYLMAISTSGTSPGLPLGPGLVLPLNPDAFFSLALAAPDTQPFGSFFGTVDDLGVGDATFSLPSGSSPVLAGLNADFAYVTIGVAGGAQVTSVSNAVGVALLP